MLLVTGPTGSGKSTTLRLGRLRIVHADALLLCRPARCEWACYDTLKLCNNLTQAYQDEMHRSPFPYKFKIKCAGCPNDCVAAVARADLSVIGIWKDDIQQDDAAVVEYASAGLDIQKDVCNRCPSRCMSWNGEKLAIENHECVRCMHCINAMPKALRPGKERGAALLIGSKAPIVQGALLSSVLVPFVPEAELLETIRGAGQAHLGVLG